jgi:recombinational DNA repair protein (RecF pathway)
MFEYFDEGIILKKEPLNEADYQIHLYAKNFGKMAAKVKSAQKITSKLSAHLEPGNLIKARIIEKNGLQIIEALKISRLPLKISDLEKLNSLLAENQPDEALWEKLLEKNISWRDILKILGWDPDEAVCSYCHKKEVNFFSINNQNFLCSNCSLNFDSLEWLQFVDF